MRKECAFSILSNGEIAGWPSQTKVAYIDSGELVMRPVDAGSIWFEDNVGSGSDPVFALRRQLRAAERGIVEGMVKSALTDCALKPGDEIRLVNPLYKMNVGRVIRVCALLDFASFEALAPWCVNFGLLKKSGEVSRYNDCFVCPEGISGLHV